MSDKTPEQAAPTAPPWQYDVQVQPTALALAPAEVRHTPDGKTWAIQRISLATGAVVLVLPPDLMDQVGDALKANAAKARLAPRGLVVPSPQFKQT